MSDTDQSSKHTYGKHSNSNKSISTNSIKSEEVEKPEEYELGKDINLNSLERQTSTASRASSRLQENLDEQERLERVLSSVGKESLLSKSSGDPLPLMGRGKDYPPMLPDVAAYTVEFDGPDDPTHPYNWSLTKKILSSFCLGCQAFVVSWGSSAFSAAIPYVCAEYGVSQEVGILGISLYVLGFVTGPNIWAPLSELYGRRMVLLGSCFTCTCFQFAVATSKDIQSIMICRFFAGFFGASQMVVGGSAFTDLYDIHSRGIAVAIYSACIVIGPNLAPIAGAFMSSDKSLGWRWTEYITGIIGAFAFIMSIFFCPESYHPVILIEKAEKLRRRTGNWGIRASHEEFKLSLKEIVTNNFTRPLKMLGEPIMLLITIYNSFIYGVLYLFLTAYPYGYENFYHWTGGKAEVPYIGFCLGQFLGGIICILYEPRYVRAIEKNGGKAVPEARLPPMMFTCWLIPIGFIWFTWTCYYADHVHWVIPIVSGIFSGMGILCVFLSCINYLVDTYLPVVASCLAGNTICRSLLGAIFPLFATYMFDGMGFNWAGLLLGIFSLALCPVPFLFFKYGKRIREKSRFALKG